MLILPQSITVTAAKNSHTPQANANDVPLGCHFKMESARMLKLLDAFKNQKLELASTVQLSIIFMEANASSESKVAMVMIQLEPALSARTNSTTKMGYAFPTL